MLKQAVNSSSRRDTNACASAVRETRWTLFSYAVMNGSIRACILCDDDIHLVSLRFHFDRYVTSFFISVILVSTWLACIPRLGGAYKHDGNSIDMYFCCTRGLFLPGCDCRFQRCYCCIISSLDSLVSPVGFFFKPQPLSPSVKRCAIVATVARRRWVSPSQNRLKMRYLQVETRSCSFLGNSPI